MDAAEGERRVAAHRKTEPAGDDKGRRGARPGGNAAQTGLRPAPCGERDHPAALAGGCIDQRGGTGDDRGRGGRYGFVGGSLGGCDIGGEGGVARGQRGNALAVVLVEPTVGKAGEVEKPLGRAGLARRRSRRSFAATDSRSAGPDGRPFDTSARDLNADLLMRLFYDDRKPAVPATCRFPRSIDSRRK